MPFEGFGEIAEKLRRSTVQVSAGRGRHGSGVIIRPEGLIVTNAHVAAFQAISIQLWDGTRARADLVSHDTQRDLAVLRIARSDLPATALADSDGLRVGELVLAIGNPLGFVGALTTGIVHAIGCAPGLGPRKWVQADIRLAPGNSGGPLADARGRLVGINTMIARGIGMAVPSNSVARFLDRSIGNRSGTGLGVVIHPVSVMMGGKTAKGMGFVIREIAAGSAAESASLTSGDILVGADDVTFECLDDFEQALQGHGERVVRLQFLRGDRLRVRTVAVRLCSPHVAAA